MTNHSEKAKIINNIENLFLGIEKMESSKSNLEALIKLRPKKGLITSVDYAITLTLKPAIYIHDCVKQLDLTSTNIVNLFHDCKLTLIAELTKTYNIHYHGIISIPFAHGGDPKKIFFDRLRKYSKVGSSKIEQITDFGGWSTYINKDIATNITNGVIYPILKDDYKTIDNITLV